MVHAAAATLQLGRKAAAAEHRLVGVQRRVVGTSPLRQGRTDVGMRSEHHQARQAAAAQGQRCICFESDIHRESSTADVATPERPRQTRLYSAGSHTACCPRAAPWRAAPCPAPAPGCAQPPPHHMRALQEGCRVGDSRNRPTNEPVQPLERSFLPFRNHQSCDLTPATHPPASPSATALSSRTL